MKAKYSAVDALKEHLLSGHRITAFEANALFGVQSPTREISQLRKQGFLVKSKVCLLPELFVGSTNLYLFTTKICQ